MTRHIIVTNYISQHDYTGDVSDVTRNVKTLTFHPNGPDFVASAIRGIMRVCETAYVRVGSRLTPRCKGLSAPSRSIFCPVA